ncbi:hypothetical protein SCLCIDRAFT_1214399 [Scleroderma citrinum Foug A]|uniref:Uncharacterized protein n=1 Tax=Scleroderma citrinum Foug A TaxID=1036808 RepID=A0A0C3ADX1_9AGAM|nr:hypothetical protein SCLCIDRAFT_1214399 [Scleroderma citrinum Foug A]
MCSTPIKMALFIPPSCNIQAVPSTVSAPKKNNLCAYLYCKWVQCNHHTPDFKCHIRTHTCFGCPAQCVCCGVLLKDLMFEGCRKEFSRHNALKCHLNNEHMTCISDMNTFTTSYKD